MGLSNKNVALAVAGLFTLISGVQAEVANFDFDGNVVSTADSDNAATGGQFTFNNPSATVMFAGFNDPQSNLDRIDFTFQYSVSSNIVVDVTQNVSPQNGFGDTLTATAGFSLDATGTGATAGSANVATNNYDVFFVAPGDNQSFAPDATVAGVFTGALSDAERDAFLVSAMVPVTVSSEFSNRFQAATEISFDRFTPFEVVGSLELTFVTSPAETQPPTTSVPLPGSAVLLFAGMLTFARRRLVS